MSIELLKRFAGAKPTTGRIVQVIDGKSITSHVGKLRGAIVSDMNGNYKHATIEAALACAKNFRDRCKSHLSEISRQRRSRATA
jgi:hypothetical protein